MQISIQVPEFILGENTVLDTPEYLKRLEIKRPLLVTDQGLVRAGHVARLMDAFGVGGAPACFDLTRENPTANCVDLATQIYLQQGCDGIVALGGGSVIDTAKLTAVTSTHGGSASDYLGQSDKITNLASPIVAIPTTAGTGSEASSAAGIHPSGREISRGVNSRFVVPRLAICDPSLMATLPSRLTAATGLDALSHCIEGYLARGDHPIIDLLALQGIRLIKSNLSKAVDDNDPQARAELMLAAFYGGLAIGKGLGAAHAIAISCGDQDLHHGVLSALGLVAILDSIEHHEGERCRAIKDALDLDRGASLSEYIRATLVSFGLPRSLSQAGYRLADFRVLAQTCEASYFNKTSRVRFRFADFESMLQKIS